MLTEKSLSRLTKSFKSGFLADDVLQVLGMLNEGALLDAEDRVVLKEALDQLDQARLGFQWIKDPKADPSSAENASYFKRAVKALRPLVKTPQDFKSRIAKLMESLNNALAGAKLSADEISGLREYFVKISRGELHNTVKILSASEDKNTFLWQ